MHRYGHFINAANPRHRETSSDDFAGDDYRDLSFDDELESWDTNADDSDSAELEDADGDDSLWETDRLDDADHEGWLSN